MAALNPAPVGPIGAGAGAGTEGGVARASAALQPGTPGRYAEWSADGGGAMPLAARWEAFFRTLGTNGWADMASRLQRVQHRVREEDQDLPVVGHGPGA